MKRAGLIGHPVGHSISPVFQQAAFDALLMNVRYERWDTPVPALERRVLELRAAEFLGANVTVPHKQAVVSYLDDITGDVQLIGAANTIVKRGALLIGHNTDVEGFRRALTDDLGYAPQGKDAAVLGAGGGARAVVAALAQERAGSILVLNRTLERAAKLVAELGPHLGVPLEAAALGSDARERIARCDLVVNCTSVGLAGSGTEGDQPLPAAWLPHRAAVADIIANPVRTPWLVAAERDGHPVLGGLSMLVHQGALSFSLWTGVIAPFEIMMRSARAAMGIAAESTVSADQ